MNSKDYRNIREAYLDVYNDDLREEQEFKSWVTELLDEGYDLSDYTWDEMYDIYNEERAPGVKEYPGGASYSLRKRVRKSDAVKPAGKKPEGETSGYGQPKDGKDPLNTPAKDERNFANALAPKPKAFPRIFGKLDPDNTRNSEITSKMGKPKPEAPKRKTTINASYDLYDIILSHLLDEGYADTQEAAEVMMVNMSEEWKESIVVEDIESRREMLKQQRIQQRTSSTEAQKRKRFKDQDRESLKKEIIKALIHRQQTSTK